MAPVPKHPAPAIGQRFGRYVVLTINKGRQRTSDVRCDCGETRTVRIDYLAKGLAQSCGCARSERIIKQSTMHGEASRSEQTPEWRTWISMRRRCTDPDSTGYENYGGRGISVCQRWLGSFEAFLTDVGRRPSDKYTIDRYPDNDGNYEPTNVRWATRSQQRANQRPHPPMDRDSITGQFLRKRSALSSKD